MSKRSLADLRLQGLRLRRRAQRQRQIRQLLNLLGYILITVAVVIVLLSL